MFRPPPSDRSAGAANPPGAGTYRNEKPQPVRRRFPGLGLGALLAVGVRAGPVRLPRTTGERPCPTSPGTIADELRRNAEDVRVHRSAEDGGTLTLATVSEPLTFNLAVSNDASSSDVLGYLFEGLTETSWLSNEVEPALAAVVGGRTA